MKTIFTNYYLQSGLHSFFKGTAGIAASFAMLSFSETLGDIWKLIGGLLSALILIVTAYNVLLDNISKRRRNKYEQQHGYKHPAK